MVDIDARAQQWRSEGRKQQPQQGEHQEGQTVRAVEEQLREEEISVDRKRADRTLSPDEVEGAFREQTVEVTATREQPVVSKQARVVEEVSIGKSQHEREEVVRDKVRRTKLDVEQEGVKQDS